MLTNSPYAGNAQKIREIGSLVPGTFTGRD